LDHQELWTIWAVHATWIRGWIWTWTIWVWTMEHTGRLYGGRWDMALDVLIHSNCLSGELIII
jgi:hypothetical protein